MMNPAAGVVARRALLFGVVAGATALVMAAAHAAAGTQVKIDNFTFSPPTLTISKGTEVTWVNQDDIPHLIVVPALNLRSHALDTDQQFSYRFDKAGTYPYICGLHPNMKGRILVTG
jgi:plastocyanin